MPAQPTCEDQYMDVYQWALKMENHGYTHLEMISDNTSLLFFMVYRVDEKNGSHNLLWMRITEVLVGCKLQGSVPR